MNTQLELPFVEDLPSVPKVVSCHQKRSFTYEDYVGKFDVAHTTDDTFTPPAVYDCVLAYCKERFPEVFEGKNVVRPFYPDGDFESFDYTDSVVVDNPPFSIFARIMRFYQRNKVPFFLFGPHLTILHDIDGVSVLLTDSNITYANKAKINTSFVHNFLPEQTIELSPELQERIYEAQDQSRTKIKLVSHHKNVLQAATLGRYLQTGLRLVHGVDFMYVKKAYVDYKPFARSLVVSDSVATLLGRDDTECDYELTDEALKAIDDLNSASKRK